MSGSDKTIIVSGCTRGIGNAICETFAAKGYHVAGFARNEKHIHSMASNFSKKYPQQKFLFSIVDATDKVAVKAFGNSCLEHMPDIEILVNNAGTFYPGTIAGEAEENFESLMSLNVEAAYYLTRTLLPGFLKRKKGHVFNLCSIASLKAYPNGGAYTISKTAMLGFSRQLRMELEKSGIRVTALLPGAVLTDSWDGTDIHESSFIKPAEIASTVLYISSLPESVNVDEIIIRPTKGDL